MIAVPAEPEKPEINSAICVTCKWRVVRRLEGNHSLTSAGITGRNVLRLMAIFWGDNYSKGVKEDARACIRPQWITRTMTYYIHPRCDPASTVSDAQDAQWYPQSPCQWCNMNGRQRITWKDWGECGIGMKSRKSVGYGRRAWAPSNGVRGAAYRRMLRLVHEG